MVNTVVFDIETKGDVELARVSGWLTPTIVTGDDAPRNYKKQDTIDAWVERRNIELVDEIGEKEKTLQIKNNWFARVVSIGYLYGIDGVEHYDIVDTECGYSEADILKDFWERIEEMWEYRWISFNGKAYDLPVCMQRSLILGVPFPWDEYQAMTHPYQHTVHVDLHNLFKGSLDNVYFYLFREHKKPIDFSECTPEELREHLLDDLKMTKRVYDRVFS